MRTGKRKVKSNRAIRRELERDVNKGKGSPNLSPENLLFRLKYTLNPSQAEQIKKGLSEAQIDEILGKQLPKSHEELRKNGVTYNKDDFHKELYWYTDLFKKYSKEINIFLTQEELFESCFLRGDYSNCHEIVKSIEDNICVSHWSLEKKVLIAEYETGFKRNKEVLSSIVNEKNDPLTDFLIKTQSLRVEKNLSFFKYEEMLNSYLNQVKDVTSKEYYNFRVNFYFKLYYNFPGFILNVESSSSIIDKYNTFIVLLVTEVSKKNRDSSRIISIKECLEKLDCIKDRRILNILYDVGVNPEFELEEKDKEYILLLNHYFKGEYNIAQSRIELFLTQHSNYFELYEYYIYCLLNLGIPFENIFDKESLAGRTLENLYNIIVKNNETQSSIINCFKTYNTLGLTSWSYKCFTFFNKEHSYKDSDFNYEKFSQLYSNYINIACAGFFAHKKHSDVFLNNIENKYGLSTAITFYRSFLNAFEKDAEIEFQADIPLFYKDYYSALIDRYLGKYPQALSKYQELKSNSKYQFEISLPQNNEVLVNGFLLCYLNLNDFEKALELTTTENINNPNLSNKISHDYLIDKIKSFDDDILMQNISTPIILHQYQHHSFVSSNDLWIAYDNFLSLNNINYPREIEKIQHLFDRDKLIYFLKNICKQDVYDSSYLFESQDELDNERIEVCLLLTSLDPKNLEEYINEISEISRNQLIRKGIKQIDESKIYVDVKGIKKSIEKDLKESFDRSLNLLNLPLEQIQKLDLKSDNVLVPYYGKSNETNKVDFKDSNIKITSYSRFEQFIEMFSKVRDKFIASNEFGIDTYLSMRIRHGTLQGEIRSVFETYQLITKKEDTSEKYQDNSYWLQKNLFSDNTVKRSFNQIMADFSFQIDRIADLLKNKDLQIKTEKRPSDGLFDYSYAENELLQIFTDQMGAIENFDEFFESIINLLWERTERNLSNIRIQISDKIKEEILLLLSTLSKDIEQLINKYDYPDLNGLIRNITSCQTDISYELNKVSEWFKRSNSKTINEFYLNLPVDATVTMLKRLFKDYSNLTPNIVIDCDMKFEGEYFPHFTYLIQNLIHNTLKHSQLPCEELKYCITIKLVDGKLFIITENNFSKTIDLQERNGKIDFIRNLLLQPLDNEKMRKEDGTGFLKIKKTIQTDLMRENYSINLFDVDESRIFKSEVIFETNNLQKIEL